MWILRFSVAFILTSTAVSLLDEFTVISLFGVRPHCKKPTRYVVADEHRHLAVFVFLFTHTFFVAHVPGGAVATMKC